MIPESAVSMGVVCLLNLAIKYHSTVFYTQYAVPSHDGSMQLTAVLTFEVNVNNTNLTFLSFLYKISIDVS